MHQSRILSVQLKYVLSILEGRSLISPFFTPSTAGFIISSILTNHCCLIIGSTVVWQRSCTPTLCECGTTFTKSPCSLRSSTSAFLHSYLSIPAYFPAFSFIVASSLITTISSKLWRFPTSKSLGSCAGVIFTQPVPNSLSTYESAITGISLSVHGSFKVFPMIS